MAETQISKSPPTNALVVGEDAETRDLVGAEKAAALLLALGPDHAKPIFDEFDEIDRKSVV